MPKILQCDIEGDTSKKMKLSQVSLFTVDVDSRNSQKYAAVFLVQNFLNVTCIVIILESAVYGLSTVNRLRMISKEAFR